MKRKTNNLTKNPRFPVDENVKRRGPFVKGKKKTKESSESEGGVRHICIFVFVMSCHGVCVSGRFDPPLFVIHHSLYYSFPNMIMIILNAV